MKTFSPHSFLALIGAFVLGAFLSSHSLAQRGTPQGESLVSADFSPNGTVITATNHDVFLTIPHLNLTNENLMRDLSRRIVEVSFKPGQDTVFNVIYDDGSVTQVTIRNGGITFGYIDEKPVNFVTSESVRRLIGDAAYVLTSSYIYVSRDNIQSWSLDTTGLSGAFVHDIALDSSQNIWAAATNGVYTQNKDTSMWRKNSTAPSGSYQSVFVDRRNNIFASYNGRGVYVSTDKGSTWTLDSAGIGAIQVLRITGDAFGNTYATANVGTNLFRRLYNSPGWTRVDAGLLTLAANPNATNLIREVAGDTALFAATAYGQYRSTDQGVTWTSANTGIQAANIYGLTRQPSGKIVLSTSLGVYYQNAGDTAWTKTFPPAGYLGGLPLYQDGLGNVYTTGVSANTNTTSPIWKSTDGGGTWNPDTAGSYILNAGIFHVDEAGTQHLATGQYGSSFPSLIYSKPPGGSWTLDTAGFKSANYSFSSAIRSDRHGYLFVSGSYSSGAINAKVMRRAISGGTWTADTAGIGTSVNYFSKLMADKRGTMYGGSGSILFRRGNGTWQRVSLPAQLASNSPSFGSLSFDSSNVLFASFSGFANSKFSDLGVYFTRDSGATWTHAGVDTVLINGLVSYGDSTFAYTSNGVYVLTTASHGASVRLEMNASPASYVLDQNYPNPFNPTTTMSYQLSTRSFVTLQIFDVLGREVTTVANEEKSPGRYVVRWDAGKFASGVYFYRLKAAEIGGRGASFVETKKMLLMK